MDKKSVKYFTKSGEAIQFGTTRLETVKQISISSEADYSDYYLTEDELLQKYVPTGLEGPLDKRIAELTAAVLILSSDPDIHLGSMQRKLKAFKNRLRLLAGQIE